VKVEISEGDLRAAAELLLRRGEWGVARGDFGQFGGDRRGRAIMAELRKRGILPVVVAENPAGDEVYKVAASEAEFQAFRQSLVSRIEEL
jgi:hypothetical protein